MNGTVIPLPVRRPKGHPALGPCTDCGSEDVRPLHDDSAGGRVVAARCISCGWLVSIEELARLRAVVEGVLPVGAPVMRADDPTYIAELADAVEAAYRQATPRTVKVSVWVIVYRTAGGTVIVASSDRGNDNGLPRDLMAVLSGPLEHGRVLPLYIGTNPEVVSALAAELTRRAVEGRS